MRWPKGPQPKVPTVLVDLWWDLWDRRLLPLVALVVVAIAAVPFLLAGGSKEPPAPVAPSAAAAAGPASDGTSTLTVVEAKPGLRDYRRRLRRRSATDPFKQRYTSPLLKGTKLGGGKGESSSSSTSTTTSKSMTKVTKTSSGKTTTKTPTETTGESGQAGQLTLSSFAIDVKITRTETKADGSKVQNEPTTRHRVIPPAPLPSEKAQVVTYMGINPETRMPLLLISDEVTAVFGEGKCLSGAHTCQLIEVEPGFPETFVFGPDGVRYKINVLKIEPVLIGQS